MPRKAGVVHFNKDTTTKLEKFPRVVDSVLNEEGIDLYNKVLSCAKKVYNSLGDCYREEIYTQALAMEIRDLGYTVETEVECDVIYRDTIIGKIRADLIATGEEPFVIEAKRLDIYRGVMQLIGYMRSKNIGLGYTIGFQKGSVGLWCVLRNDSVYLLYDGTSVREILRGGA
jgi:GxxExxY protein